MAEGLPQRVEEDSGSDEDLLLHDLPNQLNSVQYVSYQPKLAANVICSKLTLPEHIAAHQEKQELIRDETSISCDNALVEKVMSNYIIAKEILSNLSWQDKMLCKHVCTTWRSAVNALARERLHLVDFVYNTQSEDCDHDRMIKSGNFENEPMAVIVLVNSRGPFVTAYCKDIHPCPCKTPCDKVHSSKS